MKRRGEPKARIDRDHLDKRKCHNLDCRRSFTPVESMSGESTEYHCSPECAAACLKRRRSFVVVEGDRENDEDRS